MKNFGENRRMVDFSPFRKAGILLLAVCLFCVVAPQRAEAAIAFDATSSAQANNTSSLTWQHTVGTGGSDRILVVGVSWRNSGSGLQTVSGVTYNAQALTLIRKDEKFDGESRSTAMYYLTNPPTGSAYNIVVSFSLGDFYKCVGGAISLTGVDQTTPVDAQNGTIGGVNSAPSVSVTTNTDNAWVVDTVIVRNPSAATTVGAGQTQRWNRNMSDVHGAGSHEGPKTPAGSVTMSWTTGSTNSGYAISAVAFKPAGATNSNPDDPTITDHNDGSTVSDNTPTLGFTQSDPDASEQVKYQIQIDGTDNTFTNLVVDYTSDFMAEGATSFTVGQAAGTGTYTVGSQGQVLSNGSYYWRVKSIDDEAAESGWSTANSGSVAFTVDTTSATGKVWDTFTESADTALTSHTPDIGTGWTEVYDSTTPGTDAVVIASSDIVEAGYGGENDTGQAYTAQPAPTGADQDISITLKALDTSTGTKPVGIFGRRTDNSNFYHLQILPELNTNGYDTVILWKFVGAVDTQLGSFDATLAVGDTIKLEIRDATKKVYINGVERISSTYNELTEAGTWGIYFGNYNGAGHGGHSRKTWDLDNFLADEPGSQSIKIQRGTANVPVAGTTQTAPADFVEFGSLTSAFVLNKNNQFGSAGASTPDGNDKTHDDTSLRIELTATNTITFSRVATSDNQNYRADWESWEYIGNPGGPNEFIVRSRNTVTLSNTERTKTAVLDNTPIDIDRCIPFITGISTDAANYRMPDVTAIAWLSGTNTLNVERGGNTNTTIVQIVTVEFAGANWRVAHGLNSGYTADTGTITLVEEAAGTGTTFTINDTNRAFVAATQHRSTENSLDAPRISDSYPVTYISSATQVSFAHDSTHNPDTNQKLMVHVLENPGLSVWRTTDTQSAAGDSNVDISAAGVTDLSNTAVFATGATAGTGTSNPRGRRNYRLTSTTNLAHWCTRSGNNSFEHRIEIVTLPMSGDW
jgi:hypothetical protein